MAALDFAKLKADLRLDEGTRLKPYTDTAGKLTIGTGRNLTDVGISADEADMMLTADLTSAELEVAKAMPWSLVLPDNAQRVLVNLCFNMGLAKLQTFGTFLGLLRAGNLAGAAADLKETAWYGQVGSRGPRMVGRLTGAD